MNKLTLMVICCALLIVPSIAQVSPSCASCSPVGTWYGGGDYKYIITITPIGGSRFTITSEAAYSQAAFGYTGWTSWSGELVKTKNGHYVAQEISMYTTSPAMQPPPNSLELDAVRGWMEFINCDNIKFSYDFFGAYFDLGKVPFVDSPDLNYLPPGGITETYSRMPGRCPACALPATPAKQLRQAH